MAIIEIDHRFDPLHRENNVVKNGFFSEKMGGVVKHTFPEDRDLKPEELISLTDKLSAWHEPEKKLAVGDTEISVYRLTQRPEYRDIYESPFRNVLDRRLLAEARKSYRIYGTIPEIDQYDEFKAHNYAVQFTDDKDGLFHRRITFLRYVPYTGIPYSNEDFDHYVVDKPGGTQRSLISAIRTATGDVKVDSRIVTQSRLCTVDFTYPYGGQRVRDDKYLPLGFALASLQFFDDTGMENAIITGQLHTKLSDEKLNYRNKTLPFLRAHEFLGVDRRAVHMDLHKPETLAHRLKYAGYCLDIPILISEIESLVAQGTIKESALDQFFPKGKPWPVVKERKSMSDWAVFGEMITNMENANGNKYIAEKLLQTAIRVPDGPDLRIIPQDYFLAGCQEMVDYAQSQDTDEPGTAFF